MGELFFALCLVNFSLQANGLSLDQLEFPDSSLVQISEDDVIVLVEAVCVCGEGDVCACLLVCVWVKGGCSYLQYPATPVRLE